ncbi:MAG: MFS transporter, partial [Candidatus Eremiobacteraeota bacterium]|nr:MFS transporter [Candidatus Eremiobacteraeota bacterium]
GAATLAALRLARVTHAEPPQWRDAFEGLRFIASRPVIAGAISLDLFAVLFGGATALLPAFADTIFHVGPTGLGAMRSAPALGAAVVAAAIARRPLERHVGRTLLIAVAGFGLATIGFGIATNFVLSLALLVVVGGTDMVSVVIRSGLVQLATPNAMRGRVNAVENVFIGASNELGEFESGTLAGLIGVVPAVVAGGVGTLAVIALWGVFFPALRRADRIVEPA